METLSSHPQIRHPWNKGKLTGQKPPLKLSEVWAIRTRLQMTSNIRELAMFNLAIDSKLRACDFTQLRVQDVYHGSQVATRATVLQQKTQRPVQFEITAATRGSLEAWIKSHGLRTSDFLFPSRLHASPHLSTRQYSRIVHRWISSIGLDDTAYGTHTMRRTKVSLIYRRTKNLRAVQLLLGHAKLESTVRYLGIEVDDALEMAEQTEV
ncbi:tyrosine-type recombinase/integrase [Cupriavidus necator]|uniref:Phage integrase n=1 Tax=Cupriavidus pinatubonensis (strain JMP 134 / LMG 1197) TaxID=264198 RepID=Q46NG8_CUPPJ|nr:tyrosine-type recombinase/integrase [Cupriavidus necator]